MLLRPANRRFQLGLMATVATMLLLLGLLLSYVQRQIDYSEKAAQLQADSVTALTFQFEREFLRLRRSLAVALVVPERADWEDVRLRFEILVSRRNLLREGDAADRLAGSEEYQRLLPQVDYVVTNLEAVLAHPADAPDTLRQQLVVLDEMGPDVQALSFVSNNMLEQQTRGLVGTLRSHGRLTVWLVVMQGTLLVVAAGAVTWRQHQQQRQQRVLEELNQQLEQARTQADQANADKSSFLANMSHELRTPFNGLLGMLDLMRETRLDAEQRDYLQTASESARHLLALLNDILDMSAIEAGRMRIDPEFVDLGALLREAVMLMGEHARAKGLELTLQLDAEPGGRVYVDPTRLRQIVFNLLSNAIKFTEAGRVGVILRTRPCAKGETVGLMPASGTDGACHIELDVSDTGPGLSPTAQARLFERFYQADSTRRRRVGGTGLGLNISRTLARLMGGDLEVTSQEGVGSSFTLSLPLALAAVQAPSLADTGGNPTGTHGRRLKVLVADDNPINRKLAKTLLDKLGHDTELVTNGLEAYESFRRQAFDLVLMDMHMPEMDGLESTRAIRETPGAGATVPILALTANAMEDVRQEARAAGVNDLLVKPVRLDQLARAIEAHTG